LTEVNTRLVRYRKSVQRRIVQGCTGRNSKPHRDAVFISRSVCGRRVTLCRLLLLLLLVIFTHRCLRHNSIVWFANCLVSLTRRRTTNRPKLR